MNAARPLAAIAVLAALAGCASPSYVDQGKGEKPWLDLNDVVFKVHEAYEKNPPDCVAILPLTVKKPSEPMATPEEAARVRLSLFAHISTQSKRTVKLERVDHVLAEVHGDRKALAARLHCPALIEGEVTEYGTTFLGVYSRVAAGADLKMIRAADGTVLWEGRHIASSNGGSIPIDPVGVAMDVADAVSNVRDEQILRVTDDLARRLVSTIPDNKVVALDDPAEPPPRKKAAAPARADDVARGEALLEKGDLAGALAAADQAVTANPSRADGWFLMGRVEMLDKDYKAAEPAILKAVALDQGNALYLNALGAVNAEKGATDRALAAYRMAINTDPADGFAWYNTAVLRYNAGDPAEAADAFYGAGLAYLKEGDYAKAERALSDLRGLAQSGIPVQAKIKTIEDALSDLTRRKT